MSVFGCVKNVFGKPCTMCNTISSLCSLYVKRSMFSDPKCFSPPQKCPPLSPCLEDSQLMKIRRARVSSPVKSVWLNAPCCPEKMTPPVRLDELYWSKIVTDKRKKKYAVTWAPCLQRRKRKSCSGKINPPAYEVRKKRPPTARTACPVLSLEEKRKCKGQTMQKCLRMILCKCKLARNPPSCKIPPSPSDCDKVCTPVPSFSECLKKYEPIRRKAECECLTMPMKCEIQEEIRKIERNKKFKIQI